jgi:UPF0755 protein
VKKALMIVGAIVLLGLGFGGAVLWQAWRFASRPAGSDSSIHVFEVRPGQSLRTVATNLEARGLITSERNFRALARVRNLSGSIRAGEYALRQDLRPSEILDVLTSGRSIEYIVRVSEGLNLFEIASIVERAGLGSAQDFLKLVRDRSKVKELLGEPVESLEGYLFPETYFVTRAAGQWGLVRQMVAKFKEQFERVQGADDLGLNRHQLVTLASIVEKETGAPEERPVISSVFHNRLRIKMRLQTDPTVIYGMWRETGVWNGKISRADLQRPTAYNTYVIPALPPGPIANPGYHALQAAARPAQSEFLFFVSRNDGTHVFSRNYAQHNAAVAEYQLNARAREGKSWRNLQKREAAPSSVKEAQSKPYANPQKRPGARPMPERKQTPKKKSAAGSQTKSQPSVRR